MKVILLQDVKGSGKKGDVLEVSTGYAANFLFRRKMAIEATASEVNALNNKKQAEEFHKQEELKKWKDMAKNVNGKIVNCCVKAGENGKVFGSITSKEISDKLTEMGFEVDKKKVLLKDSIKNVGNYDIEIKFLPDVSAKIKVIVEAV